MHRIQRLTKKVDADAVVDDVVILFHFLGLLGLLGH